MPKKNERGFNAVGSKYEDMKNFYTTFTKINTDTEGMYLPLIE